jgi:hypothetical protein
MHLTIARAISIVLHPALIPTYLFAIVFFSVPSLVPYKTEQKEALLVMIFLLTFAFPSLSILVYYKLKMISSLSIENRNERVLPFLTISIFYIIITYFFFTQSHIFPLVSWIMLGITLVVGFVTVLTFFYKISVHSAGASGGVGILLGLQLQYPSESFLYPVLLFVFLTGLVASARLALKAHTFEELIAGVLAGIGLTFTVLYF